MVLTLDYEALADDELRQSWQKVVVGYQNVISN